MGFVNELPIWKLEDWYSTTRLVRAVTLRTSTMSSLVSPSMSPMARSVIS
ncbi:hypothetical protein DSECCO2_527840 [anaerobic digester metagenome]